MHELSITRNVVAIVAERAAGARVTRVRLQVGRLAGVDAEAIRFCFGVCSQNTVLAGAILQIDDVAGRGRCGACAAEIELSAPTGRCPGCGAGALSLVAGRELLIKEMEVEPCA
jgi:hydrogenase nickel incorporation protein HypA/HybF